MRRWPLSTAAAVLVLAAHVAAYATDPARKAPRTVTLVGRVVVEPQEPDTSLPRSYALAAAGAIARGRRVRFPLVPVTRAHAEFLEAHAGKDILVEVTATLTPVPTRTVLVIERINELP